MLHCAFHYQFGVYNANIHHHKSWMFMNLSSNTTISLSNHQKQEVVVNIPFSSSLTPAQANEIPSDVLKLTVTSNFPLTSSSFNVYDYLSQKSKYFASSSTSSIQSNIDVLITPLEIHQISCNNNPLPSDYRYNIQITFSIDEALRRILIDLISQTKYYEKAPSGHVRRISPSPPVEDVVLSDSDSISLLNMKEDYSNARSDIIDIDIGHSNKPSINLDTAGVIDGFIGYIDQMNMIDKFNGYFYYESYLTILFKLWDYFHPCGIILSEDERIQILDAFVLHTSGFDEEIGLYFKNFQCWLLEVLIPIVELRQHQRSDVDSIEDKTLDDVESKAVISSNLYQINLKRKYNYPYQVIAWNETICSLNRRLKKMPNCESKELSRLHSDIRRIIKKLHNENVLLGDVSDRMFCSHDLMHILEELLSSQVR